MTMKYILSTDKQFQNNLTPTPTSIPIAETLHKRMYIPKLKVIVLQYLDN